MRRSVLEAIANPPPDVETDNRSANNNEEKYFTPIYRKQILFGVNLSNYPAYLQFLIPAGGLFCFMCLAGYLQELVVYGLFERKWSYLQTFLHYIWFSICAEIQNICVRRQQGRPQQHQHNDDGDTNKITPLTSQRRFLSMGTASMRISIFYYFLLTVLKTLAVSTANLSMRRINYPAKTLCKSARPIVVMLIGIIWFRKTYPLRDYVVSFFLVLGLYLFIAVDATTSPQGTFIGLSLITVSLVSASSIGVIQEHILDTYEASSEELLYYPFLGSTILSFLFLLTSGEAFEGLQFLLTKGDLKLWLYFTVFNTCGFAGAHFVMLLTSRFGSVVTALTSTSRKAVSITLSFLLFPDRNALQMQHILGASVFFLGIALRGIMKGEKDLGGNQQHKKGGSGRGSVVSAVGGGGSHYRSHSSIINVGGSSNSSSGRGGVKSVVSSSATLDDVDASLSLLTL